MSARYMPVTWNRHKLVYDALLIAGIATYILLFLYAAPQFQDITRPLDKFSLRIQAFGSCAFLLLTMILCIGPLARLDARFLPLLYNRRHFGVLTCAVAGVHASYVLGWYFAFSPVDPYVALLSSNVSYGQLRGFPFEILGIFALLILLVMAATSHDFWLRFLGPPLWKAIHMAVYPAYAAIVLHIGLGHLQSADSPVMAMVTGVSVALVAGLHVLAAWKETRADAAIAPAAPAGPWVQAGAIADIPDNRALVVTLADDERVAIFRYGDKLSAVTNVCAHQNGPLGEGRIIGGCVTCPWHGFQYRPEDGCAPAPFTEKIATYRIALEGETILLDPRANPPGTYVEPLTIGSS